MVDEVRELGEGHGPGVVPVAEVPGALREVLGQVERRQGRDHLLVVERAAVVDVVLVEELLDVRIG